MSIIDHLVERPNQHRALLTMLRETSTPTVIYGAGIFAQVLLRYLEANQVKVLGLVVDSEFRPAESPPALNIMTIDEIAADLPRMHVVIGITNYPKPLERIRSLGARSVHVIDVPDYLNMPGRFMDIDFVKENRESFDRVPALLADELSRDTFIAAINAKINEDPEFIRNYVRVDDLYFPSREFPLRPDEVFLDVGGFTGDSVREFHQKTGGNYRRIISLEPCIDNFNQLKRTVEGSNIPRVTALHIGAWRCRQSLRISTSDMRIDNRVDEGGNQLIEVDAIDSILEHLGETITLAKFDINGAEYPALEGARKTLARDKPRVAVRLHRREDFFRTPILLSETCPGVRLLVRQRGYMSMMLVMYAVFG